jgi:lysophospholipase L1-like esterase
MHIISDFIKKCQKKIEELIPTLRLYLIFPFLALMVLSSRLAFPEVHAAPVPTVRTGEGRLISDGETSFGNVFLPFTFSSGPNWPDLTRFSPTPSPTSQPGSPHSTATAEETLTSGPTLPGLPTAEASITLPSTLTPSPTSTPTPTSTATPTRTPTPTQDPQVCQEPVWIMPLGDSITRGSGSTSINGYRKPLYQMLIAEGHWIDFIGGQQDGSSDFDRNHEGHSGWSADGGSRGSIANNVYSFLTANPADIVLLHIGTNDVQEGHQDPADIARILDEIRRKSGDIQVVLALIINQATYSPETTQYNDQVRELALERIASGHALTLLDMENALSYPSDLADALHPNDSGYAKMAGEWFDALTGILPDCTGQ